MSAYVKLSMRAARQLAYILETSGQKQPQETQSELRAAIAKAERAKSRRVESRKPSEAARASKREETAAIRAAVVIRAKDACEVCGSGGQWLELDHFFGRGRGRPAQSARNTWLLCATCHRAKTLNRPSASIWLLHFKAHCAVHGYEKELATAESRLAFIIARGGK